MARFKVNDLITNGSETLWVTEVTDTRYVFTDQDGYHSTRRFEQIDSCFRLYEPKKIWHKPEEEPANGCEVLFYVPDELGHEVGFWNKGRHSFIGLDRSWPLSKIEKWAYLIDLASL